ncbi:unnamed protein product, partial [Mesorhabditis belari]|uniref:RING-type domain-containing protein n=1 Tax=Mesorhabditis belari TaxID=2138241 RepID=A0AAF3J303_9BILA
MKLLIFESLNCILCEEPFVPIARQPRSPRLLLCGSAMCHECFEEEKSLKQEEREHKCDYGEKCFYNPNFAYCVIDVLSQDCFTLSPILGGYLLKKPLVNPECPICHDEYEDRRENWLQDFLNELPEMTYQLEEMNESGYRFCDECKKLDIVDEMHHCKKCSLQLCGNCIYKNHRSHKAITLLQKEELSDGLQGFDQKLLKKKRDLTNASTFEALMEKHKKCTELTKDLEKCSEEYMPHLRKYEKRVKELMKTLDDDPN